MTTDDAARVQERSTGTLANWFGTFTANTCSVVLGAATGILSARLLNPDGRGSLAAVLFWPQLIAGVGVLSLNDAFTWLSARHAAEVRRLRATALWVGAAASVIVCVATLILLPHLLQHRRSSIETLASVYCVAFLPLNYIAMLVLGVELGRRNFRTYNAVWRVLPSLVYLVGLGALWLTNRISVAGFVWANVAGVVATGVVAAFVAGRDLLARPSVHLARQALIVGSRFHVTTIATIGSAQIDRAVVLLLLDDTRVGLYVAATTIAYTGLSVLNQTVQTIMLPATAGAVDGQEQAEMLARIIRVGAPLTALASVFLAGASPLLLRGLFGHQYQAGSGTAAVLAIGCAPRAFRGILVQALRGMGHVRASTVAEVVATVATVVLALPLARLFDLVGVALACLAANTIALAYLAIRLERDHGVSLRTWLTMDRELLSELMSRANGALHRSQRLPAVPLVEEV